MSEKEKYDNDPRTPCKYAKKCYQKNPDHIKKFKHPPKCDRNCAIAKSPPKKMARLSKPDDSSASGTDLECRQGLLQESKNDNRQSTTTVNTEPANEDMENLKKIIKSKFLVEMAEDFYSFFEFCKSIQGKNDVKDVFKCVNLFLVGPYDVLAGTLPKRDNDTDYLIHWRYYYDPPEFQTILMSNDASGFHLGYYRDSPNELPAFVASNEAHKSSKITSVADNIFGAVLVYLEAAKKKSPFMSISCQKLITQVKEWADRHHFTLETNSSRMKKRKIIVVSHTFHGAGIVVPFDKKTQVGYRPLVETDAKLKILIENVKDSKNDKEREAGLAILQPVITYANIATDECDFGSGLELGIDLFSTGEAVFHNTVSQLLNIAYSMLNRNEYQSIINAHLANRRKGSKLSCADL